MGFKVGDKVTWTGTSNGTTKAKTGAVEAVIEAGERPTQDQMHEADSIGMSRDHVS